MAEGGYDDPNEPLITHDDDDDYGDDKLNDILKRMKASREEWENKSKEIREDREKKREAHKKAQEALNETQPFRPGQTSTPYHGGEQVGMQTTLHEQTGPPPPSYAETSFGGGPTIDEISLKLEKLKKKRNDWDP